MYSVFCALSKVQSKATYSVSTFKRNHTVVLFFNNLEMAILPVWRLLFAVKEWTYSRNGGRLILFLWFENIVSSPTYLAVGQKMLTRYYINFASEHTPPISVFNRVDSYWNSHTIHVISEIPHITFHLRVLAYNIRLRPARALIKLGSSPICAIN